MRKLPQPACIVLGVLALGWGLATFAKDPAALRPLDPDIPWRIAGSGDRFVAVAKVNGRGLVASSTNGTHWQVDRLIVGFNAVTGADGKFIAVGESGAVGLTTNGTNWRISSIGTNELCAVFYQDGCWVAVGCAPVREFFTSREGFIWTRHEVGTNTSAQKVARFLDTWVTGTNVAAGRSLTSIANEVRSLCRAKISGK